MDIDEAIDHYAAPRPEVARVDRDMDIVERLRLGGPNAMEVVGKAADEIELLRKLLGESARREGDANGRVARLQHRIERLSN